MAQKQLGTSPSSGFDIATKSYVDAAVLDALDLTSNPWNLTVTAVKTSAYTTNPFELVSCDATSASFNVTLPAAPADNSQIIIKKIDTSANTVTVQRSASDVFNKSGGPTYLVLSIEGESVSLYYRTGIWYVIEHSTPYSTNVGKALVSAPTAIAARTAIGAIGVDETNQFAVTIGDGIATSIPITHNLSTLDVLVSVHRISTGKEVDCDVTKTDANTVTLDFAEAPEEDSLRCVVIGTAFGTGTPAPVNSSSITDSTVTGRALITATDAAAARSTMGAGTSSLVLGTTSSTAKAGDYQPSSANISDSTEVGRSLLTAADAAAARATLGSPSNSFSATVGDGSSTSIAVTHNLGTLDVVVSVYRLDNGGEIDCDVTKTDGNTVTLGFVAAPALNALRCTIIGTAFGTGSPTPTESVSITDSTAVGRAVLTAEDAVAARTAIGAGTPSLAAANISDSTSIGRQLITAASAAAARVAISTTKQDQLVIDFRDHGLVGDGTSRPLSGLFDYLSEAQAVYPAALSLDNELDWAAMQSAIDANPGGSFLIHSEVHAITNRPLVPTDFSTWQLDGIIENVWPRNTPSFGQFRSNVIMAGNIHPYILKTTNTDTWDTYALNDTTVGDRQVTVTTPAGLSLASGDIVIVRSDTNPVDVGLTGRMYDFVQFNKVTSYNSGTGVVTLELPMGETVAAAATLTGPTLCVNTSIDPSNNLPWKVLDGWSLHGRGTLIGGTPLGDKMGMWRCRVQIRSECQDLLSAQAAVKCHFDVSGTFTNRCLEVKFAAWESTWIVDGVYKPDTGFTPLTTISIGEQATGNDIHVRCHRGTDHSANVRIFEDFSIRSKIRAELYDYSTGGQTEVVALRSTSHLGRPPSGNDYDFLIRTITGSKTGYLSIGSDANNDTVLNDADPRFCRWNIDARSSTTAPAYLEKVVRNGGSMVRGHVVADTVRANPTSGIEVPENAVVNVATIAGAVTYTANTTVLLGSYTLSGVKSGDCVDATLQMLQSPSSGTFGDLYVTATISAGSTVRVYIQNRSGTDVVFPAGNILYLYLAWKRHRV